MARRMACIFSLLFCFLAFCSASFAVGPLSRPEQLSPSSSVFILNQGQYRAEAGPVDFAAPAHGGQWLLHGNQLAFMPINCDRRTVTRMQLANSRAAVAPAGLEPDAQYANYYLEHCPDGILNVPTFRRVIVPEVYDRTDWLLAFDESGNLKYDFRLQPGADPSAIRLKFLDCQQMGVAEDGSLWVRTPGGYWTDDAPTAWTQDAEPSQRRQPVQVRFRQYGADQVGFDVEQYDSRLWLYIDPLVRVWSTFYGGKSTEFISNLQTQADGGFFISGFTHSLDLPMAGASQQGRNAGASDAFVAKLDANGRRVWTTYFGGKENDQANALTCHARGGVSFVGTTNSSRFPVSKDAHQTQAAVGNDAFVVRLDEAGQRVWASYYGGRLMDEATGVAALSNGRVVVCGTTESFDLTTTPDAVFRRFRAGGSDAFLVQFSEKGQLQWATFYGGHSPDYGSSLAAADDQIYFTGVTHSENFPVTGTSFISAPRIGAEGDAFVARFDTLGHALWATCIGGSQHETVSAIALDRMNRPAIVGYTQSNDLPVSALAPQKRGSGFTEAFVSQFSSAGEPLWSTYLGGDGHDFGYGIASSPADQTWWVCGKSLSGAWPIDTEDPIQSKAGKYDGFIVQLTNSGSYLWGSFLGGANDDELHAIAALPRQEIIVAGRTASPDFPVDPAGEQPRLAGGWDGLIAKYRFTSRSSTEVAQPFQSNERPPDEDYFTFQIKVKDVSCKGASDGAIELDVAGGTPPYTFAWSNGATTQNLNNIPAGAYTFTVTDAGGVPQSYFVKDAKGVYDESAKIIVKEPAQGLQVQVKAGLTNCGGGSDGRLEAVVTGGSAPYVFRWSNGANSATADGLSPGSYTVTVTDAKGCTGQGSAAVSDAPAIKLDLKSKNASCADRKDGSIALTVAGGTQPFTYRWSDGNTQQNRAGLSPGSYAVTVTDAKGCLASGSANVAQPTALELTANVTPAGCSTGNDGRIDLSVSGGTPPYKFKWSNGVQTQNLAQLNAGSYSVTATDAAGCTAATSAAVSKPIGPKLQLLATNPLCHDTQNGAIDLTVTGGMQPYRFQWSNGATGEDLKQLGEGTYSVTVFDGNNCQEVARAELRRPAALTLDLKYTGGGCDASASASAALRAVVGGGTAPHQYRWSNGTTSAEVQQPQAGEYAVTVVDVMGCSVTRSIVVEQAQQLTLSGQVGEIACSATPTGSINLTVSGGKEPLTYRWSNGATSQNLTNLKPGSYAVTVTDSRKCVQSASFSIADRQPLRAEPRVRHVSCHNGNDASVKLAVTGGTPPYSYQWNNGLSTDEIKGLAAGSFSVEVKDAKGCSTSVKFDVKQPAPLTLKIDKRDASCTSGGDGSVSISVSGGTKPHRFNWAHGATESAIKGLKEGPYTVTVMDSAGCTAIGSVMINRPQGFTISVQAKDVTCAGKNDGKISLAVTGGKNPFIFKWSNGSASKDLAALPPGTYTVTATDSAGCSATGSAVVKAPPAMEVKLEVAGELKCSGQTSGALTAVTTGGSSPFKWAWSTGATADRLTGLGAGSYAVTVTDANGCAGVAKLDLKAPAALAVKVSGKNPGCDGGNDGSVSAAVSGGTAPYSYRWSSGAVSDKLEGVGDGKYSVSVTDANGCEALGEANLTRPSALSASVSATNPGCGGANDGKAEVTISGGKEPFVVLWSNGSKERKLINLPEGRFSVTVTDGNGCKSTATASLVRPPKLEVKLEAVGLKCSGQTSGALTAVTTGGSSPFKWAWSTGATADRLTGLGAGSYAVTVTDANGCAGVAKMDLKAPAALAVKVSGKNPGCDGGNDGSVSAAVSGGTAPYSYRWSSGAVSDKLEGVGDGKFSVSVTDANGCEASGEANLTRPSALSTSVSATNPGCGGANDGKAEVTISGGKEPFVVLWSNGSKERKLINLPEGKFSVTVTDGNGCKSTATASLVRPPKLEVKLEAVGLKCSGQTSGALTAVTTGGSSPFKWVWSTGATSDRLTGLGAGSYAVTVTDGNGCAGVAKMDLKAPAALAVKVSGKNPGCDGGNDGSVSAAVSGGTAPYSYRWSSGAVSDKLEGVGDGKYSVSVTDANGCEASGEANLTRPSALSATVSATNPGCGGANDGKAEVTISGGKEPFVVLWSNGSKERKLINLPEGRFSVTVTDGNGCKSTATASLVRPPKLEVKLEAVGLKCSGQTSGALTAVTTGGSSPFKWAWSTGATSDRLTGLGAGSYAVTVTDANGCAGVAKMDLKAPAALAVKVSGKNPGCDGGNDGSVSAAVSGGTAPYSYRWSSGAVSDKLEGVGDGKYSVSVTDANGCEALGEANLTRPSALSASVSATNPGCGGANDGKAEVTISGGKEPFVVLWSNGSKERKLINLPEGRFSVTVTDGNGCKSTATASLVRPPKLEVKLEAVGLKCSGQTSGALTAVTTGGSSPFKWAWSTGATSDRLTGLGAGSYAVTVTDANGCAGVAKLDLKAPAALAVKVSGKNPGCDGGNDGSVSAAVSGGTAPYSYRWSSGAVSDKLEGVGDGKYSVSVTDANGCEALEAATLARPVSFKLDAQVTEVQCPKAKDAAVRLILTGGKEPYVFAWSTGGTAKDLTGVGAGEYSVTVSDANGCRASKSFSFKDRETPELRAEVKTVCPGQKVDIDAGAGYKSYKWSTGTTERVLAVREAGMYSVEVVDERNCKLRLGPVVITAGVAMDNVQIRAQGDSLIAGEAAEFQWYMNNVPVEGGIRQVLVASKAGTYKVRMTSRDGCSGISASYSHVPKRKIDEAKLPTVNFYPNPAREDIMLQIGNIQMPLEIVIKDPAGAVVYQKNISAMGTSFEEKVVIRKSGGRSGTYIMTIRSKDFEESRTILVRD